MDITPAQSPADPEFNHAMTPEELGIYDSVIASLEALPDLLGDGWELVEITPETVRREIGNGGGDEVAWDFDTDRLIAQYVRHHDKELSDRICIDMSPREEQYPEASITARHQTHDSNKLCKEYHTVKRSKIQPLSIGLAVELTQPRRG
jgi:hypothetical protein